MTAPAALARGDLVAVRWAACPQMARSPRRRTVEPAPALVLVAAVVTPQGAALLAWGLYELIELQGDEASNRDVAVGSTAVLPDPGHACPADRRRSVDPAAMAVRGAAVFIELIALGLTWEMLPNRSGSVQELVQGQRRWPRWRTVRPGRAAFGRGSRAQSSTSRFCRS